MTIAQTAAAVIAQRSQEDLGFAATYRPVGVAVSAPGTAVKVWLAPAPARMRRPEGAAGPVAGAGQTTHDATRWRLATRAMAAGEVAVLGVGSVLGGVEQVRSGDTFVVEGRRLNRPDKAELPLRVAGEGRHGDGGEKSGYWVFEVTL